MNNYHAPETALLDLEWLVDQAGLFITSNAIDCELEARIDDYHKVSGCSGSTARELFRSAPAAPGALRAAVARYLAHLSVEEIYDPYLDRMGKLELACRKEEASRQLDRMMETALQPRVRRAA